MSELATALIVDDDKQIRRLLRIVLEEENYKVLESNGGESATSQRAMGAHSGMQDFGSITGTT